MATEAQKKANARYRAESVKQKRVKFFPKDHDLFEWVSAQERQNEYILALIREDMDRRK